VNSTVITVINNVYIGCGLMNNTDGTLKEE